MDSIYQLIACGWRNPLTGGLKMSSGSTAGEIGIHSSHCVMLILVEVIEVWVFWANYKLSIDLLEQMTMCGIWCRIIGLFLVALPDFLFWSPNCEKYKQRLSSSSSSSSCRQHTKMPKYETVEINYIPFIVGWHIILPLM